MIEVPVFDAKRYDRKSLSDAASEIPLRWRFLDFRLTSASAEACRGAEVVCVFVNDQLDRTCLKKLAENGVKLVLLRCAGFNNVDVETAKECGISVARVPAYSPHAVAEHAVALLMALNRKLHRAYQRVREQNFSIDGLVGVDLYQKSIGIVGTGKIGRVAAQIFRGFGARVLAVDPFPDQAWARSNDVEYVEFDALLPACDVISLHAPLLPETKYLLNEEAFKRMRPGVFVVNTSRGKLIDTTAMIQALKSGHLGGVALDVYEEEEGVFFEDLSGEVLADDELARLLSFPNVVVTAHQAFLTREALSEIARVTVDNIRRFTQGEPPAPDSVVC